MYPLSWGGDTLTFSAEARIMRLILFRRQEDKAEEDTSGKEAAATLSEVIKKATGGVSTTSPAEQIEALEKKLKELQTRLAQVAASSMPERKQRHDGGHKWRDQPSGGPDRRAQGGSQ